MDLDKLLEISEQCIHTEPPVCLTKCPVHLDVLGFIRAVESGDFKKAYKTMESKIPFARLIGQICEHPCDSVCVRSEAGGSICLWEIEKAVIEYGYTPPKKKFALPKKKGQVAIVGGGLSGLVAAVDLDKKGFKVTIYECAARIGGRLWEYEKQLGKDMIEKELEIINKSGIQVKLDCAVTEDDLNKFMEDYDAVYLGTGNWKNDQIEKQKMLHKETFQVGDLPLFMGGKLAGATQVIYSASTGRRAAVSIDRYIKKTSLTASREKEGEFETKLEQKIDDVSVVSPIERSGEVYTEKEAIKEAERCLKCQCTACVDTCVHMQKFETVPNEYIRSIMHNERIIKGTHYANKMINSCTECGLCYEVCPVDISMKDIIHEARRSMVEREKMPPSAHDFALKDMAFSTSENFSMVRAQPSKEASKHLFYYPVIAFDAYARGLYKGSGKTGFLFYPGCQLSATHADYIGDLYKHLVGVIKEKHTEEDVGLYLGCCGAPADWAGRDDLMKKNQEDILKVWNDMGKPTFILACSSCVSTFEKYMPEIETTSLWEVLDQYGLPDTNIKRGKRVLSVHDACATRHYPQIHTSIRNISKTLGYKLIEPEYGKENTKCCGYGGLVAYANPDQAKAFSEDRKNEGEEDSLVYCAMCKDSLVKSGKQAFHMLDIIYGQNNRQVAEMKMPSLSDRQNNRKKLKADLLKTIWNEDLGEGEIKNSNLKITLSKDVEKKIEERFILLSDITRVIKHSLETEERFLNEETGAFLARLRSENVTFWVKYRMEKDEIYVTSAYSHRMEVVEG